MAGFIRCRTSSLGKTFAIMRSHAAECALIDFALGSTGKWHTVMFQFDHRRNGFATHIFNRVLIAQPIGAFHRVVHMKSPVVLAHITQGSTDTALRSDRVTARRKDFGDARCFETFFCHAQGCAQPCPTGTDYHHIISMFNNFIICGHELAY